MSKKQRLKAQKEKQDRLKKELEEYEKEKKEEAKERSSKSAAKMRKKASRRKAFGEPVYVFLLKLLMIIPYGYSGFFYGGVLTVGVFAGYIEDKPPKWVGWCVLLGSIAIGVGVLLAFLKKYKASFALAVIGTVPYMKSARYMINKTKEYLAKKAVEPSLQNLDKTYMKWYYPILGVVFLSAVLLIIDLIGKHKRKKKLRYEQETAPVESIVD